MRKVVPYSEFQKASKLKQEENRLKDVTSDVFFFANSELADALEKYNFVSILEKCLESKPETKSVVMQEGLSIENFDQVLPIDIGVNFKQDVWNDIIKSYEAFLEKMDVRRYHSLKARGDKCMERAMVSEFDAYQSLSSNLKEAFPRMTQAFDVVCGGNCVVPVICSIMDDDEIGSVKNHVQVYIQRQKNEAKPT